MLKPYTHSLTLDYVVLGLIYNIQITEEGLGVNYLFKQKLFLLFGVVPLHYFLSS